MEVTPGVLEFKGDFLTPSTEYLYIKNESSGPLAFKVKTTAPKLYSVRPNANIVNPGESIKISIILQAFSQPLSKHYKCKDKFLIVSLPCSEDVEASKVSEIWPELEKAQKPNSISKKLKVNYIIQGTDEDEIQEEKDSKTDTTSGAGATNVDATASKAVPPATAAAFGSAIAAGNAINKSEESNPLAPTETKELADSYQQINKLNEKFDETEKDKTPSTPVKQDTFSGISLPLTVILMLLAFIIGWLIF